MKAVIIKRKKLTLDDIPEPIIERNHVLVSTVTSVVSPGTERSSIEARSRSMIYIAKTRPDLVAKVKALIRTEGIIKTLKVSRERINEPSPLGYSSAGIVITVGDGVEGFKEGDRVACAAPHAEIALVPKNLIVKIPEKLKIEEGAFAAMGGIALQGVRRADIRIGDVVVVIGLGIIGILTLQIARAGGAKVLAVDPVESRSKLAKQLGAFYSSTKIEDILAALHDITDGHGADATIVTASARDSGPLQMAISLTRKKGKVVIVGGFPIEVERQPFYEKELDLFISCSIGPGRYDPHYEQDGEDYPYPYVRWTENRNMEAFLSLVADDKVDIAPLMTHRFAINNAIEAYDSLLNNPESISIVIDYSLLSEIERAKKVVLKKREIKSGKIRVGIIGTGNFARSVLLPNIKGLSNHYEIAAICTRSPHTAKYISESYDAEYCTTDYQVILKDEDIDMVVISTRHDTHARIAMDAIKAGKHVFLEKPAALTPNELQELLATLRISDIHFMVGFNRRYSPAIRKIKKILDPLHGRTVASYHVNAGPLSKDHWVKRVNESGGRIIGECIHFVDLLRFIIGSPIIDVRSVYPSTKERYENSAGVLLFENGSIASIIYGNVGPTTGPREIIEIQKGGTLIRVEDFQSIQSWGGITLSRKALRQVKGHREELILFAKEIQTDSKRLMNPDEIENVHVATFKMATDLVER